MNALTIPLYHIFGWIAIKSLKRQTADLIILAADTEPLEILLNLPLECEEKNVHYVFVPSKVALGLACGISRAVIACSILANRKGELNDQIQNLKTSIESLME